MERKQGSLSISSENIFPIIKKWVYSDHDIFAREMISNGCDAITKLKKLDVIGEYQLPDDYKPNIQVIANPDKKTLKFIDNGIGMTADEVEEYITQIAFSGATEFLEKYKDKTTEDEIIGHFGLGFYSAFMVADEVHIDTLSYKEGATPVHWVSDGGTTYEMEDGDKATVGTEITLFLSKESTEFSNEYRIREVLEKYCSFMPVPIYVSKEGAPQEYETVDESELKEDDVIVERIHEEAKTEEKEKEDGTKETVEVSPAKDKVKINKRPVPINDIHPLWAKHPNDCTKEDYIEFYRKVFMDYREPLFWIHLNMDYPFNLKGILYFPKINAEYESIEGTIKLYNNQVFIADNIKEVIPEFLMVLKGVIDCPDLPLNVSRSALQNDGFVNKISDYISKKVADKLVGMCKTDKESYEKYWDDISPFIKFGCLKDTKFCDRMSDYMLFKNLDHKYLTLKECIEENDPAAKKAKEEAGKKEEASGTETPKTAQGGEATVGDEAAKEAAGNETNDQKTNTVENEDKAQSDAAEEKNGDAVSEAEGSDTKGEGGASDTKAKGEASEKKNGEAKSEDGEDEGKEKEKEKITIFYVTDERQQSQYINMFKAEGMDAVILNHNIDSPFISQLEQRNENIKFQRIDADVTDTLKQKSGEEGEDMAQASKEDIEALTEIFRKALGNDKLNVKIEKLKNDRVASMMTIPEESRRMQEMMKMYGMSGDTGEMLEREAVLVLNVNHPLVQYVLHNRDGEHTAMFCRQLYDLAMIAIQPLSSEAMTEFIKRSNDIMMLLAK